MKKDRFIIFIFFLFIINSITICYAVILPEKIEIGGYYWYPIINPDIVPLLKFLEWGQYLFLGIILLSVGIFIVVKRKVFFSIKEERNYKKVVIIIISVIVLISLCLNLKQIILDNNTKDVCGDARDKSYVIFDGNRYYLDWR